MLCLKKKKKKKKKKTGPGLVLIEKDPNVMKGRRNPAKQLALLVVRPVCRP